MSDIWKMEPALITGSIGAVMIAVVAFGVPINPEQQASVIGAVAAIIALGSAWVTRSQVYSPHSVEKLTGELNPPVPSA